jgi:hypothetical protein
LTRIVVGVYAWLASVAFGASLLDVVYARAVPESEAAFARVADLLLIISAVSLLAALVAIVLAWSRRPIRNLLSASLALVVLGLLAPAFLSPPLPDTPSALGAATRIFVGGVASVLALLGFHEAWI